MRVVPPRRFFAIGDLQTRFEHLRAVLTEKGYLGSGGWLRPEVGLVAMGDYFDFGSANPPAGAELEARSREGVRILEWLAAHPPDQVVILLGNHDAVRVTELAGTSDDEFAAARDLALRAHASQADVDHEFSLRFPGIPTPESARRDFATFHSCQRQALQKQLLAGRVVLGAVGERHGRSLLITHAGVTLREIGLLGLPATADAREICRALGEWLHDRVGRVREAWELDEAAPLDLAPLHVAGTSHREAGGLLSHRPANPDLASEVDPDRPRRFHPLDLPPGLGQVCGHTRAGKAAHELRPWATERALAVRPGALRTLRVAGDEVTYDAGVLEGAGGSALLYLVDVGLDEAPPEHVDLLEFDRIVA
jgi:hypothetical protein